MLLGSINHVSIAVTDLPAAMTFSSTIRRRRPRSS
jgi:hypothetical protein